MRKLLLSLVCVLALMVLPAGQAGAASVGWTVTPQALSSGLDSVSCVSTTFCAAVGRAGTAYVYDGSSWTEGFADTSLPLDAVSCGSPTMCVAGSATVHSYLTWDGSGWSVHAFSNTEEITSVSCVAADFCLAVDGVGNSIVFNGSSWGTPLPTNNTTNNDISVSCVTSLFCEDVDSGGNVYTYSGGNSPSWSETKQLGSSLYFFGVSCATSSFCAAVDNSFGEATIGSAASWSTPQKIDGTSGSLNSVSCPNVDFCMAGDGFGNVLNYDNGVWGSTPVFPGTGISRQVNGISCPSFAFCVAVAQGGDVAIYRGPVAPTVVTDPASSVTQTGATLNGTVNPNGSFVTHCLIDWGTSTSYDHTATCTPSPGAGDAVQVSTTVNGLQPDTTYHFTVVASNAGGTSVGQDQTFITGSPPRTGGGRALQLGVPFSPVHSIPLVSAMTPPIVLLQTAGGGHSGPLGHVSERVLTIDYVPSSDPAHELQTWLQAVQQGRRHEAETITLASTTSGLTSSRLTFGDALPISSSTRVVAGEAVEVMRIEYGRASTGSLPTTSVAHGSLLGTEASVTVRCGAAFVACAGTLNLETAQRHRRVIVATGSYTLAGGEAGTVVAKLTSAGKRLHHLRSIRVTAFSSCSCLPETVLTTQHVVVLSASHGTASTGWSVSLAGQRYTVASVTGLPPAPPSNGSDTPGRVTFDIPVAQATAFTHWLAQVLSGPAQTMTVTMTDVVPGGTLQFQLGSALPVTIVTRAVGSTLVKAVSLSYSSLS